MTPDAHRRARIGGRRAIVVLGLLAVLARPADAQSPFLLTPESEETRVDREKREASYKAALSASAPSSAERLSGLELARDPVRQRVLRQDLVVDAIKLRRAVVSSAPGSPPPLAKPGLPAPTLHLGLAAETIRFAALPVFSAFSPIQGLTVVGHVCELAVPDAGVLSVSTTGHVDVSCDLVRILPSFFSYPPVGLRNALLEAAFGFLYRHGLGSSTLVQTPNEAKGLLCTGPKALASKLREAASAPGLVNWKATYFGKLATTLDLLVASCPAQAVRQFDTNAYGVDLDETGEQWNSKVINALILAWEQQFRGIPSVPNDSATLFKYVTADWTADNDSTFLRLLMFGPATAATRARLRITSDSNSSQPASEAVAQLGASWTLYELRRTRDLTDEADRVGDRGSFLAALREYRRTHLFPAVPETQNDTAALKTALNGLSHQVEKEVTIRRVAMTDPTLAPEVEVFFFGDRTEGFIAPTGALIDPIQVGSAQYFGRLDMSAGAKPTLTLRFSGRLYADPLLANHVAATLKFSGETLAGILASPVMALTLEGEGVHAVRCDLLGATFTCAIELEIAKGGLALWRLATHPGLRAVLSFPMDDRDGQTRPKAVSTFLNLTQPLTLRANVSGNSIDNPQHAPISIRYIKAGSDFRVLNPPLVLGADERREVKGESLLGAAVPIEALRIVDEAAVIGLLWKGTAQYSLEVVHLRNSLLPVDQARGRVLERLQVVVAYTEYDSSGAALESQVSGEISLSPFGVDGSEKDIWFVRTQAFGRRVRVNGVAHFAPLQGSAVGDGTTGDVPIDFQRDGVLVTIDQSSLKE
jgi:hypothetical protein